jgi:hypothetical protein
LEKRPMASILHFCGKGGPARSVGLGTQELTGGERRVCNRVPKTAFKVGRWKLARPDP